VVHGTGHRRSDRPVRPRRSRRGHDRTPRA
jgi:hypothetical protein